MPSRNVRDVGLGHATDDEIIQAALARGSIVVTRDKDFGSVLRYPDHPGAVLIRLPHTYMAADICRWLAAFLDEVKVDSLRNAITVVEVGRYRRRPLR